MTLISTNIPYSYTVFQSNLSSLKSTYSFLDIEMIGSSVLGKQIPCIRMGNGTKHVLYSAAFHANEWITAPLLMKFIEDCCQSYTHSSLLFGFSVEEIFKTTTIHLVPMINPDGVNLVTGNLPSNSSAYLSAKEIASRYPNIPFVDGWKANINGVDLKNYQPVCKVL